MQSDIPINPSTAPKRNWKGIISVAGCFLVMIYLGCFFLWGNISIYVLSYFYEIDPTTSYDFIFLVDSFLVLSNWIGYNVGTYLLKNRRWHPKLVIGLGCALSLGGVFLSSYTRSLGLYLACYCGMNGIGTGACYFVALICGWEYFPDTKGLVTGVILSGYGFGAFIFAQVSTKLVNPTGAQPTIYDAVNDVTYFAPDVADRVPYMLRTLVYIWTAIVVVSVALITRKSERKETAEVDAGVSVEETIMSDGKQVNKSSNGSYIAQSVKYSDASGPVELETEQIRGVTYCFYSIRTYQFFFMLILSTIFGTLFSYTYKIYGENGAQHPAISDGLLTWAASIGSGLVNGLSRIVIGTILDRVGFKTIFTILMLI